MGVISDAIDALEDWCCDLFKDSIKSQFDGISELLTDTFAQTTGSGAKGNLVSNFLTKHPAQFTGTVGSAPTGYGIWATIETLCNNVVVPIGGFILTVILLNELCQMANTIVWLHYTEIMRKPVIPINQSYIYFTIVTTFLLICNFVSLKKLQFVNIEQVG